MVEALVHKNLSDEFIYRYIVRIGLARWKKKFTHLNFMKNYNTNQQLQIHKS